MSNYSSLSRVLSPFRVQTKFEENTLPASYTTDIMAYCFVVGTLIESTFEVTGQAGMSISALREIIYDKNKNYFEGIKVDANKLYLWKVDIPGDVENDKLKKLEKRSHDINDENTTIQELGGEKLTPFKNFGDIFACSSSKNIRIIAQPPQPATTVFETVDEVLRKVDSHWERLKEKLVKKIELEEFRVSDHIYKDSINASGIPVIEGKPSFLLHSLPDSDNDEGYIPEDVLTNLIKKVMGQSWLFLMGTSGSGKTRSLYELLCKTYGIYFSLNTGNGSKNNNLGSRDMDLTINDLSFILVPNKPQENSNIALIYTRAILLGRLFILTKLLEFHRDNNFINFTPKQWLLMQLFPLQIYDKEDFWYSIACNFRNLDPRRHNELVATFVTKFESFVPKQARLPIAIDESQSAIEKYKNTFVPTNPNDQTRPFFVILLRMVLHLSATKLCLILSGTGMSFDDIKNFASSSIAKLQGPSFEDFFFIHDGFYEDSEINNYIQRFLPLNDESMKIIFNIFRGRRRFLVQFLNKSLLDNSSMSRNVNENVEKWQNDAKDYIISTFKESCFPKLRENKEVWNKVIDIVTLSMFSNSAMIVRRRGVIEMVQYGFAQLCDYKHIASDQDIFQKDVIEAKIQETIPFLAFKEYVEDCHDRNEIEKKLLQDLCDVHYLASCAGYLYEPYLTISLEKFFNEKICMNNDFFTGIKDIDNIKQLLSYKSTIRNLKDSTTLCSKGDMKEYNLFKFLDNPSTAFFMPEKEAGPDLVCIINFETPDGIVEVPLFLQAKLWKTSPPSNARSATDPNTFYPHGNDPSRIPKSKIDLKEKVINCLRTKYHGAYEHGLSWISFLVTYPVKFSVQSQYIRKEWTQPGTANNPEAKELLIVIDSSNAKYFFSKLGINVLNAVKRVDEKEIDIERPKKKIKIDG